MKKILSFFIFVLSLVSIVGSPALAARPVGGGGGSTSTAIGNDISWPQCGKQFPATHAFGIVGVNGYNAADINW
nr:hypothetical protein [bacterium]